jgi:hypothetical protein
VCESSQDLLRTECPACESIVDIEDLGEGTCDCGHKVIIQDLFDTYGPIRDPKEEFNDIYCSYCEMEAVIPLGDDYLCLSCLERFADVGSCDWCGTYIAGFCSEDSGLTGCILCEGRKGWDWDS